jgi:hypothetical protein
MRKGEVITRRRQGIHKIGKEKGMIGSCRLWEWGIQENAEGTLK